jgi:hypothetical protein
MPAAHRDILDTAWGHRLKKEHAEASDAGRQPLSHSELTQGFFADVSQSITRRAWGVEPLRTLTQSTVLYSFQHDAIVRPEHHFRFQGWGVGLNLSRLSPTQMRSLAGEGFALPSIGTALWSAVLVRGPWWDEQDGRTTTCCRQSYGFPCRSEF